MEIRYEGVRTICNNCDKHTVTANLRLGIFGIPLCADCLKELGEMAQFQARQMGSPQLPDPVSSLCNDLSTQNIKNQQLQNENDLLRSVLRDAYTEASSDFTGQTKMMAEKMIGLVKQ